MYADDGNFVISQGNDVLFEVVKSDIGKTTNVNGDLAVSGDTTIDGRLIVNQEDFSEIVSKVLESQTKLQYLLDEVNSDNVIDSLQEVQRLIGVNGSLKRDVENNILAVSAETTRAVGAEQANTAAIAAVQAHVDANEIAANDAIAAVQADVDANSASIQSVLHNTDATALNSLAELVNDYKALDGNLKITLSSQITAVSDESDLDRNRETLQTQGGYIVEFTDTSLANRITWEDGISEDKKIFTVTGELGPTKL